jgi:hypothetical protein
MRRPKEVPVTLSLLDRHTIESGVAVWSVPRQEFVPFIPCPGEERVRLDVHDDLSNYRVHRVEYLYVEGDGTLRFRLLSPEPLDWRIDLS